MGVSLQLPSYLQPSEGTTLPAQAPLGLANPGPEGRRGVKTVAKWGHSENLSALSSPLGFGLPQSYPMSYFRKPKLPTVIISPPRDWFSFVPLNALYN